MWCVSVTMSESSQEKKLFDLMGIHGYRKHGMFFCSSAGNAITRAYQACEKIKADSGLASAITSFYLFKADDFNDLTSVLSRAETQQKKIA